MPEWLVHVFRRRGDERPYKAGDVVSAETADEACNIGIRQNPGAGAIGVSALTPIKLDLDNLKS